jgi:hypothetical protein
MKKLLIISSLIILSSCTATTGKWVRSNLYVQQPIIEKGEIKDWKYYPLEINTETKLLRPTLKEEENDN